MKSAHHAHIFLSVTKQGRSAIFSTSGNEDCHIILRGGGGKPNFDSASIRQAARALEAANLTPKLMVDMSHANSNKQYRQQLNVNADICRQLEAGETRIMGVMIESNLVEGRQDLEHRKSRSRMVRASRMRVSAGAIRWSASINSPTPSPNATHALGRPAGETDQDIVTA